jgi:predicted dehydrogenase
MRELKRTLNAGFIGVGNFIQGNHLPNIASSKLWRVHSVCDINESNLKSATERFGPLKSTNDYRMLLEDPEVDAIILGVRHREHLKFIKEVADAGKHVFVEKPMSMTNEESHAIVECIRRNGVKLQVGFNRRFGPLYSTARNLFQKQHRGKAAMLTFRAIEDSRLWLRWPFDLNDGGGLIIAECCHFFDFLPWFVDDEPVRIFCEGDREENNIVTIRFAGGSIASIVSGGKGSVCYPKERLEVFCEGTTLIVDNCLELHAEGYPDGKDQTWPFKRDPYPDDNAPASCAAYREKMRKWRQFGLRTVERKAGSYYGSMPNVHKGHFEEIEAFARAILSDLPSPCDEIDGARSTACCVAGIQSMERGYVPVAPAIHQFQRVALTPHAV